MLEQLFAALLVDRDRVHQIALRFGFPPEVEPRRRAQRQELGLGVGVADGPIQSDRLGEGSDRALRLRLAQVMPPLDVEVRHRPPAVFGLDAVLQVVRRVICASDRTHGRPVLSASASAASWKRRARTGA